VTTTRILYLVPGPLSRARGAAELERRREILQAWAAPGVEVGIAESAGGPGSIESAYEEYLAVPALVEALVSAEREGVDAIIVGCFDDPGVDALRELATRTLVVGPGAAAMHLAGLLGGSFGIVTVPNPTAARKLVLTERLDARLAGIGLVHIPVLELRQDAEASLEAMTEVGKELVAGGAETIVFGCMSMGFLDVDAELAGRLGVPVVNPAKVALGVAETLVRAALLPSRVAFPRPPKLADGRRIEDLLVGSAQS
jgi:allantoin racemase